ncbi:hypothetical protein NBRC116584_07430 [Hydrogenophaga sp. 5NK40-0174]
MRRRLAWRWVAWFFAKYGLYLLLFAAAGYGLWTWQQTPASAPSPRQDVPSEGSDTAPAAATATPVDQPSPETATAQQPGSDPSIASLEQALPRETPLADPVALKFSAWGAGKTSSPSSATANRAPVSPVGEPLLQTEIWLHSKEP